MVDVFLFNGFIISGDSNLRNCKRVWGMSNTINNIPMYSTGLYMCVETPDGSVLAFTDTVNTQKEVNNVIETIKNSSNFTIQLNFSNSSTSNFFNNTNETFLFNKILQIIQMFLKIYLYIILLRHLVF